MPRPPRTITPSKNYHQTTSLPQPKVLGVLTDVNKGYYTSAQLCEFLGVGPSFLAKLRITGRGPKYIKIGFRSILYPVAEVESFLASKLQSHTTEVV